MPSKMKVYVVNNRFRQDCKTLLMRGKVQE
nr:MAG TPA: Mother cell inhibitor of FtsZ [Caudoviricetes sp.]